MPFTHVEIEEHKNRELVLLFSFLAVLHGGSILLLVWGVKALLNLGNRPTILELAVVLCLSVVFGAFYWRFSTRRLLPRVLEAIGARPADSKDTYHAKLLNIIEEVSVATGGYRIQTYVIPTPAMNACAVSDFDGGAAIAVTEGLLAALNRPQLESIVGHEAAHIVSGDSLTASTLCALFALHEETLKGIYWLFKMEEREGRSALGGRAWFILLFIMMVLWITNIVRKLAEMFISREKEYRADSVAVRLTRDPLSLAEALHLMLKKWRGVGTRGEALSSIFIMDPGGETLSEQEGFWADLFSTHPPTKLRSNLLLGMAHLDPAHFDREMSAYLARKHSRSLPKPSVMEEYPLQWMIWDGTRWMGPWGLEAMANTEFLLPEAWVRQVGKERAKPAHEEPQLRELLRKRFENLPKSTGSERFDPNRICPNCQIQLVSLRYEGASIESCQACKGCFVKPDVMRRIFSRQEYDFPEAVKRLGESILAIKDQNRIREEFYSKPRPTISWPCPRCGGTMARMLYSGAYLVEVERCANCQLTWLDADELELLQYLYERLQEEG